MVLLRPHITVIAGTGVGLAACCIALAIMVGDIGFQGDDWWIFSFPYWSSFPQCVLEYAKESSRPMEGLYWITMFELFRFYQPPYFILSLFLLAGSSILMGLCLLTAFPGRQTAAAMSTLLAFVLPPTSNLTYMMHTDNSRISMVFFWCSVLAFQKWAIGSGSWGGLTTPVVLYCLSVLTYENTSLLIFSVPLFIWPAHYAKQAGSPAVSLSIRLFTGIVSGFVLFLLVRFLVFSGGAVGQSSWVPSFHLFWRYISSAALFCATPFLQLPSDKWSWVWGLSVAAIAVFVILFRRGDQTGQESSAGVSCSQAYCYPIILGVVFFFLGTMPYLIANYGAGVGYTSQSRIYSSGSFGLATAIGYLLTAGRRDSRSRLVFTITVTIVVAFMATFFADLRNGWKEAAQRRSELCRSLIRQVPDVVEGTTFLFLDLQSYISNRAVVFQGVDGLEQFIKMLYGKKNLHAYFLYHPGFTGSDIKGKTAEVSPRGVMARGSAVTGPAPLDRLLIFERKRSQLVLLDGIAAQERQAAIEWQGITEINSNLERIISLTVVGEKKREICGH